ncbi:MAG: N-acetylmuramoyl-L-alanine amidase [Rhodospirillaceae bacterium]|nr:N-acetylmuramoyl-L-alanine amidase [Rhodospirillaceae bacterium]
MDLINHPSPNHDSREGQMIDMLVLHYTGMQTLQAAIARLTDPKAQVSAHYLVTVSGDLICMVDEGERAWHAGVSYWRGATNINSRSIGVEIENPGHENGYRPFSDIQMDAVTRLCSDILSRHSIPARNVVGHSDVAPTRKTDPGELFDWPRLAGDGIGIWPDNKAAIDPGKDFDATAELARVGYNVSHIGAALTAFQRHFCPSNITSFADKRTCQQLACVGGILIEPNA